MSHKGIILASIVAIMSGCISPLRSLKDVHRRYRSVAVVNAGFDKMFKIPKDNGRFIIADAPHNYEPLSDEEKNFLTATATGLLRGLSANAQYEMKLPEVAASVRDLHLESVPETSKYMPISPFLNIEPTKDNARTLCAALNVDAVMDIRFSYFYGFHRKPFARPNSIGILITLHAYDRNGNEVMVASYDACLGQGEEFKMPGDTFHFYPCLEDHIREVRDYFVANVGKLQTGDKF